MMKRGSRGLWLLKYTQTWEKGRPVIRSATFLPEPLGDPLDPIGVCLA